MKNLFACLILLAAPLPALAGDALAPVAEIMKQATDNWAENQGNGRDYFDEERLSRLFSKDFATAYRAAAKYPAYDDGPSPFDYDVIVNAQDGCALKDITTTPAPPVDGKTDVKVTFDNIWCFGERDAGWKPTEVHFSVIEQGGKPVIDDIVGTDDIGSLKDQMREIAKQGAQGTQE